MASSEFVWPVRVYYEDTDSGGVVYYANYLKFMERARTEWIRSVGFEQDELIAEKNVIFAVRSVTAEYLKPARFNQTLRVINHLSAVSRVSVTFTQEIEGPEGEVYCTGVVKVVSLSADQMRPVAMPRDLIEKLQGV